MWRCISGSPSKAKQWSAGCVRALLCVLTLCLVVHLCAVYGVQVVCCAYTIQCTVYYSVQSVVFNVQCSVVVEVCEEKGRLSSASLPLWVTADRETMVRARENKGSPKKNQKWQIWKGTEEKIQTYATSEIQCQAGNLRIYLKTHSGEKSLYMEVVFARVNKNIS